MATRTQMKANGNNAKKSTGPRTKQGKARVAKNALKHGLLARDTVLPGEDPADFDSQLILWRTPPGVPCRHSWRHRVQETALPQTLPRAAPTLANYKLPNKPNFDEPQLNQRFLSS